MKINVCKWKMCESKFSSYILTRLINDKERFNLDNLIIEETPCIWKCEKWPNIKIDWQLVNYMNPAKASEMVLNTNKKRK